MDYSFLELEKNPVFRHETRKDLVVVSELEQADTTRICLDPSRTPGLVHADNITAESTKMANALLQKNHEENHIFTTREDERGVRIVLVHDRDNQVSH